MPDSDFQTMLKEKLALYGLSDEEAARLFDVSRPSVSRWKDGETKPHPMLQRIVLGLLDSLDEDGDGEAQ